MFQVRDYSIAKKLTWINMVVCVAALLLAVVALGTYDIATFRARTVRGLSIQAQIIATNAASALVFSDPESAGATLAALKAAPSVQSAIIYTLDKKPFAAYWRAGTENAAAGGAASTQVSPAAGGASTQVAPADGKAASARAGAEAAPPLPEIPDGQAELSDWRTGEIVLARAIVFEGRPIGYVCIRSDTREIAARVERFVVIGALVLAMSMFTALMVSLNFRRAIADPVVRLAGIARKVSQDKNYSVRAPAGAGRDEISTLIDAFNEMLGQIQTRDAELAQSREELERRVEQRTAELEATNKELEAFTYSVAHDLRAPLRHIQGFSKALLEDYGGSMEAGAQEYLKDIVDSTHHMGCLVDDLLALARVGRQELSVEVTGLDSILQEVLRGLHADTDGREIEWRIGPLPFVECDPGLMRQVFYNLLSNAVKYSRPRKPAIIETGQIPGEDGPVIFVRDNGVGFNMKHAGKLFGVFQRLHRREDFEGTGVGLATVQRIIHKHGGRIWVDAAVDKGATFYFTLAKGQAA